MAGRHWCEAEKKDAILLSWEDFHQKWPGRTKHAWRQKRRELDLAPEEEQPIPWQIQRKDLLAELDGYRKREASREAERDFIVQMIQDAVSAAKAVKPPKITKLKGRRSGEEVAVLELSDLQMGQCQYAPRLANLGFYDKQALQDRLDRLREAIYEIVGIQRKGGITINKLIINGLGDFVEGETIYPGQGLNVDANLIEQTFVLGEHVAKRLFRPMCELFPQVEMFGIPGNHGVSNRHGAQESSWDLVCMAWWHARMTGQPNWSFHISRSSFLAYEQYKAIHLLIHGDEIKAWNRIPFYGMERAHGRYMALTGQFIQYMHVGHHHNLAQVDLMFGSDIMNGSFSGTTDYSVKKMQKGNQPKQLFFGLNEKGQTWQYDIRLAEFERLQADERGLLTPVWEFPEQEVKA